MRGILRRSTFVTAVITAALAVDPSGAQQATMQFPVQRDAGILGWDNHDGYGGVYDKTFETEEFSNHGGAPANRARKSTQHGLIMDWDTAAINAWIQGNVQPGTPMTWTFNIFPLDAAPADVEIETFESVNDWLEGDGPHNFENFNWSEGTGAATTNFAQTFYKFDDEGDKVLDEEKSLPWIDNDTGTGGIDDNQYSILGRPDNFSPGTRIPDFVNSELLTSFELANAAILAESASVKLDNDLVNALLNDPLNRGIILGPGSGFPNDNWRVWNREGSGLLDDNGGPMMADEFPGPVAPFLEVTYTPLPFQLGDFNRDGKLDAADIDALTSEAKQPAPDLAFDVNKDARVDNVDRTVWIRDLKKTWIGDANLDGVFDSADFVGVFQTGQYEDAVAGNSTWSTGDWNGDMEFDSGDFVVAFQDGGFERGPRAAAAVPEPAGAVLAVISLALLGTMRRHRSGS